MTTNRDWLIRNIRRRKNALLALVIAQIYALTACQADQSAESTIESNATSSSNVVRWVLPDKLREISGLALTDDQRLFAIADEEAIVYEYDFQDGHLVKAFALGEPTVRDDFEGIAIHNDKVWLMSSAGDIYSANEGEDGERVAYEKYPFAFKDDCELEGLVADESKDSLILVCKDAKKKKDRLLFEWSLSGESTKTGLPEAEISAALGTKRIHPSGIEINPVDGNFWVVLAREHAVVELTRDGAFIDVIMTLDPGRHPQAEGIAITNDGRLLIADEANNGPATLSIYALP